MTTKKKAIATIQSSKPINYAASELLQKTDNPWTEIPKFKTTVNFQNDYLKTVDHCRFFYRTEPLVNSIIDKLVEIGINDLVFVKNNLTANEYRVFTAVKPKLLEFAQQMATEYLLSGLVVPEVGYNRVDKDFIFGLGIKKYTSLILPDSMWVRDPHTVKIKTTMLGDKPSYFAKVPEGLASFIKSGGTYPDGTKDLALYELLKKYYADFIKEVLAGKTEFLLDNPYIFRRKYTTDNAYPIPYAASSLEALHHKRKLRRMDYSIIDKVISAIMHVKVGSDDFPITESDEDQEYLTQLRTQLRMRGNGVDVMERIFQLITNHTVDIKWIFPDTATLLDVNKYADINQEILFGMGFPRILITGETSKSGTSDPEIAALSPIKTAEDFRRKVLEVIKNVCLEISKRNGFNSVPAVQFKSINLHKFADFLNYLSKLYDSAAISRTTLGGEFGYDFTAELDLMESEMKAIREKGLPEFGMTPNSKNSVTMDGANPENTQKPDTVVDPNQNTTEKPAGNRGNGRKNA